MMKLAFCIFKYFPFGGLQRDFLSIIKACLAKGYSIDIYTTAWEGETLPNVTVNFISAKGLTNVGRMQSYIQSVERALLKNDYDLVIGFNKMPGLDIYFAGDVCLKSLWASEKSPFCFLLPRYRAYLKWEKSIFHAKSQTHILALTTEQVRDYALSYDTPLDRFHLLPPGISRNTLTLEARAQLRAQTRREQSLADDDIVGVLIASDFFKKGLDRALSAFAKVEDDRLKLWVIGGDQQKPWKQLIKKLKLTHRVSFLGKQSAILNYLVAADFLIHPSRLDSAGMVIVEALAAALPVIVTQNCGYAFHLQNADAGVILPVPFDEKTLVNALASLLSQEARARFALHAKVYADTADLYSLAEQAAEWVETIGGESELELLRLYDDFYYFLNDESSYFDQIMALDGQVYRAVKNRRTICFTRNNRSFFIKQHRGVGYWEIIKNLLQGRLPVVGAKNEWLALQKLEALGIAVPRLVGYGERYRNPAKRESFVITRALEKVESLESITATWKKKPPLYIFKRKLIRQIAHIARTLHENGLNHRDFYLCHLMLDVSEIPKWHDPSQHAYFYVGEPHLYLMDLHRMQMRKKVPFRWRVKDIAGLYFSSLDADLTARDIYRFLSYYFDAPLREIFKTHRAFLKQVQKRAVKLYQKTFDQKPILPVTFL